MVLALDWFICLPPRDYFPGARRRWAAWVPGWLAAMARVVRDIIIYPVSEVDFANAAPENQFSTHKSVT